MNNTLEELIEDAELQEEWNAALISSDIEVSINGFCETYLTDDQQEVLKSLLTNLSIDPETLPSFSYDPDCYGVGGRYVTSDSYSWSEEEENIARFQKFVSRILADGVDGYAEVLEGQEDFENLLKVWAVKWAFEYLF